MYIYGQTMAIQLNAFGSSHGTTPYCCGENMILFGIFIKDISFS